MVKTKIKENKRKKKQERKRDMKKKKDGKKKKTCNGNYRSKSSSGVSK